MPMAGVAASASRPRRRQEAIGMIRGARGRAEGKNVAFNLFPQIAAAFPGVFADIIAETTIALADRAQMHAPTAVHWRPGDPEQGTLKIGITYGFRWGAYGVTSGIVEAKAIDPTSKDPRHNFARPVEVGGVHTPAQPFMVPALVETRPGFNAALMNLEDALDAGVGSR